MRYSACLEYQQQMENYAKIYQWGNLLVIKNRCKLHASQSSCRSNKSSPTKKGWDGEWTARTGIYCTQKVLHEGKKGISQSLSSLSRISL